MLTVDQISKLTDRSPELVRRWARLGVIEASQTAAGRWVVPLSEIDKIAGRARNPQPIRY
jgi:predicted site-specific integrase-resolvase